MLLFFTVECIYFFLFFWHIRGKGMKKWRHTESFFETNRASSGALNKVGAPLRYLTKIEFRTGCDAKSNFRPPASYDPPHISNPLLLLFCFPRVSYPKFNFRPTVNTKCAYSAGLRDQ